MYNRAYDNYPPGVDLVAIGVEEDPNQEPYDEEEDCPGCGLSRCECGKTVNEPYSGFDKVA